MSSWFNKTLEFLNSEASCVGKERHFGNHCILKRYNSDNVIETVFKYYGSEIVVVNDSKRTMVVSDFGYTKGYTPRSINEIIRHYEDKDYTIEPGQYTHKIYDYWYNNASRYIVKIFDEDVYKYKDTKTTEQPNPILCTVVNIDEDMPKRDFRDNYFERFELNNEVKFLGKNVITFLEHYGIGYRFCTKHFNGTGTLLFEPARRKNRKMYLSLK